MKIFYRGPVVWNLILFIMFSFAFLYLQEVFYNLTSLLNKTLLLEFIKGNALFVSLLSLTALSVYKMNHWSRALICLVIGLTTMLTINNLIEEFSKIILVLLFFYLVLFLYTFQFYLMDLRESFYNPGFTKNDLFSPMSKKITCELVDNEQMKVFAGYLTNWSQEGCHIKINGEVPSITRIDELKLIFENHEFSEPAFLVSKNSSLGTCGIKFKQSSNKNLGWRDFYEIIEKMGYSPERLV